MSTHLMTTVMRPFTPASTPGQKRRPNFCWPTRRTSTQRMAMESLQPCCRLCGGGCGVGAVDLANHEPPTILGLALKKRYSLQDWMREPETSVCLQDDTPAPSQQARQTQAPALGSLAPQTPPLDFSRCSWRWGFPSSHDSTVPANQAIWLPALCPVKLDGASNISFGVRSACSILAGSGYELSRSGLGIWWFLEGFLR